MSESRKRHKRDEAYTEEINRLKGERDYWRRLAEAHQDLADGNYWAWQGEEDYLESIGYPVLIQAADLRKILAEIAELRTPTCYWREEIALVLTQKNDDRDLDHAVELNQIVAFDDVGDVIELRPLHELPTVWALVTERGAEFFPTPEAAEAARQKGA